MEFSDYPLNNFKNNCEFNKLTSPRVWYNHYRGYIVRNTLDPQTNRIIQERMEFNSPANYNKQIDDFFMYKLK
jgi:hypothetical protein